MKIVQVEKDFNKIIDLIKIDKEVFLIIGLRSLKSNRLNDVIIKKVNECSVEYIRNFILNIGKQDNEENVFFILEKDD